MPLAVNAAEVATPLALVTAVLTPPANVPLAPVCAGAVNVTVTPLSGLLPASFTVACSVLVNAVLTVALCGVPAVAVTLPAAPAVLVRTKLAAVATPDTDAATLYVPPALLLAVNTAEVATPLAFVTAVLTPPANVPLAPVCAGAVNVTVTPVTGLLLASFTVACSVLVNAVLTVALCGVPAVAVTLPAAPAVLVRTKLAAVATPDTDAATLYVPPAILLAVNTADVATPLAFVTAVFTPPANVPLAPVCAGAVNVTVTPLTGLLLESFTLAWSAAVNAVLIVALCGVPAVAVIAAADPAVLVNAKLAGVATPDTDAATLYGPPAMLLAVNTAEVAIPLAFVTAVLTPPANVPLASVCAGAVNVTVTPETGLLPESFTVACSAVVNAVPIAALCGVPAVAVIAAADPAVLVRAKFAALATPDTDAAT